MADKSDDEPVGYGRPPRKNRWKPGETGNRKPRYSNRRPSALEFLEKQLAEPVPITIGDENHKVSKLEAILWQLYRKMLSGERRALAVWLKYAKFFAQDSETKVAIEYVENDYTRALAAQASKKRTDDE
jgi:Family of unknown function (DUF5681)